MSRPVERLLQERAVAAEAFSLDGSSLAAVGYDHVVHLSSSLFVLLHLLITRYSGVVLIASILLTAIYGILYAWTGSVYLVGTMHAVFNLAPRLLDQWPPDVGLLAVHSIGLVIVIIPFCVARPLHSNRRGPRPRRRNAYVS
jgi:hypothetical protein